jgi:hypothetical protein
VDELPFAADRCPCVEKLRTCYHLLLASETVRCSWCPPNQCRHISMSKLGSIITSALPVFGEGEASGSTPRFVWEM